MSHDSVARFDVFHDNNRAELLSATEGFLSAPPALRRNAFKEMLTQLKVTGAEGDVEAAAKALRLAVVPTLDFTSAQSLHKMLKKLPRADGPTVRLAILGGFTTHQLRDLIELHLFAAGIKLEIYESDYGVFRQEILDPTSDLYDFRPDIILLAAHWRNLGNVPSITASAAEVTHKVEAEYQDWALLWEAAHKRLHCQVIQNNFDTPPWSLMGNHELRHPASLSRFISEVNMTVAERAPPFVTIHDVDTLAATAGRRAWANERFYLHAKLPCAPEYLVEYSHSLSSIIAAQRGLSKKCLVLDLDNTLWGGVIGDDGIGGIRIGHGDAEGEAFAAFQRYVKGLASRGVVLAVCSKNTEHIAREVFENHPDMVLALDDISCFVANWSDKAQNLRSIAQTLNLGLESLVFVDDNPAERSIVRQLVPEVSVPEVSTDPLEFIETLERHRYFQVASVGEDDFNRTDYYRANAQRASVASSSSGIEAFLESLAMTSAVAPISTATLERSTQLINKSNQFNLTTRRKTVAEVSAAAASKEWVTATATLVDRFGDNGLISVVLGIIQGDTLNIETWLMSCRVLKRGVERFLLNYLVNEARSRGLRYLQGEYIETPKNGLVRDHYEQLGFQPLEQSEEGHTLWRLAIDEFEPLPTHIQKA